MNSNDTQYAEYFASLEEEFKSPIELLRKPLEELKLLNLKMEFMLKYVTNTNTLPKAKTEDNELTKETK